jgi:hypothetical protein
MLTGVLLLAMFFTPLYSVVPIQAAAPALVIVGALLLRQITHIDFGEFRIALPAFLTIIVMPFTYSIAKRGRGGIHLLHGAGRRHRTGPCRAPPDVGGVPWRSSAISRWVRYGRCSADSRRGGMPCYCRRG